MQKLAFCRKNLKTSFKSKTKNITVIYKNVCEGEQSFKNLIS